MSKYSLYKHQSDELVKLARKRPQAIGLSNKQAKEMDDWKLLGLMLEAVGLAQVTSEFILSAIEHTWYTQGQEVLFLESAQLGYDLIDSKFKIDGFHIDPVVRMIAMPRDLTINGVHPAGLIYQVSTFETRKVNWHRFTQAAGIKEPIEYVANDQGSEDALTIHFVDPKNKHLRQIQTINLPINRLGKIMSQTTLEGFKTSTGQLALKDGYVPLEDEETYVQWQITRLVVALLVYEVVYPEKFIKGLHIKGDSTIKYNSVQVKARAKSTTGHDGKATHVRAEHYRTLHADRYYQGVWKHKPRGSRVVLVKESVIGREIDATTVVE